jgi:hypothetical protein
MVTESYHIIIVRSECLFDLCPQGICFFFKNQGGGGLDITEQLYIWVKRMLLLAPSALALINGVRSRAAPAGSA